MSDKNILAASWINDLLAPRSEFQPRKMFFNNETLLLQENVMNHFNSKNMKKFYDNG